MPISVRPFLMFQGGAEAAMMFYVSIFGEAARVLSIDYYGREEAGAEGSVKRALLRIADQEIMCTDSPMRQPFGFTPAISLFVNFDQEKELRQIANALAEDGKVFMPLDDYGFSQKFTWIGDRYGVTWQLNLP